MPRKRKAKVVVRGGEVPQDPYVPAWSSDSLVAKMRSIARISTDNPQMPIARTPRVLRRIK